MFDVSLHNERFSTRVEKEKCLLPPGSGGGGAARSFQMNTEMAPTQDLDIAGSMYIKS